MDQPSRRSFLRMGILGSLAAGAFPREGRPITEGQTPAGETPFPWTAEQIRQRLGISLTVYHFNKLQLLALPGPLFNLLENIKRAGITYLDIPDLGDDKLYPPYRFSEPASVRRIGSACREVGLSVCSFHSGMNRLDGVRDIDTAKREIDLLVELGGRLWLVHLSTPGGEDLYGAANRRGLEQLARHYEGQNVQLTVENLKPTRSGGRHSVDDVLQLVNAIDHPQVGLTIDIGHCIEPYTYAAFQERLNPMTVAGRPTEIIRRAARRLNHLHLHDQTHNGITESWQDHHAPFTGRMQWLEIFRVLHEVSYKGLFLFETTELYPEEPIETTGRFPDLLLQASRRFGR